MKNTIIALIVFGFCLNIFAQPSGRDFRRYNVLNKNLVKTVFDNGGVIGHPVDKGPRGAWIKDSNGYVGDVSPFVGCEIPYQVNPDSVFYFHSVTYCLADRRPNEQEIDDATGEFWGFQPKSGYFNPSLGADDAAVAIYTDPETWPSSWPDRMGDINDPGWAGQWNGYFGKGISNATEETYFAMDDNDDEEFNFAFNNEWGVDYKPDPSNTLMNGMGLEVKVRALQWKQFLAQDCIFWLYEIENKSITNYNKATFGMLVGTYVGVTGESGDHQEYDDDWSFFDAELDITYTGDYPDNNQRNALWDGPVGMVGYAFLESPGNPFDGIDNDNDGDENTTLAPKFQQTDFDSVEILPGTDVVLIDENFERTTVKINSDTTVESLGHSFRLIPGVTKLIEGNRVRIGNNWTYNENANDGIDNDLDGIIDENYYLHYWQRRVDNQGKVLINILRPIRYKNYLTGQGVSDLMIDESRTDGIDNDNDWNAEFDDVGLDGIPRTFDIGESDGEATSGAGTGLPGEPNIDITDVDESDQIGLTSFEYFINVDVEGDVLTNDEAWWDRVAPGQFDVPSSIVENEPIQGEDGDFFYASGYFPLLAGNTERFSLALVYGGGSGGRNKDLQDLLKNRETMQKIYDSNYQFPKEPDTPTLTATASDGKVILSWDRKAELSFDPVLKVYDFEGYRLYKSSQPDLSDIFIVTDADGKTRGYQELAQWDLKNGIAGYFQGTQDLENSASGFSWKLGEDTGLQHSFVDEDVINGKRYFYVLTAYDRGDVERDIFPAESPFIISEDFITGEIKTGQNAAMVVPGTNIPGYTTPDESGMIEHVEGPGSGKVYYNVLDPKLLKENNQYRVEFWDSSNDGLDNDGDWDPLLGHDLNGNGDPDGNEPNVDQNDPDEYWPLTSLYSVRDLTVYNETFIILDSLFIDLAKDNIVEGSIIVRNAGGTVIDNGWLIIDYSKGRIRPLYDSLGVPFNIGEQYSAEYEYFPVYKSEYIGEINDDVAEGKLFDSDIFDGLQLSFLNDLKINLVDSTSGWNRSDGYDFSFSTDDVDLDGDGIPDLYGKKTPHNFAFVFDTVAIDTSASLFGAPALPTGFSIYNTTLGEKVEFLFVPLFYTPNSSGFYDMNPNDQIFFFEKGPKDSLYMTWLFLPQGEEPIQFMPGDSLILSVNLPFRRGDVFQFVSEVPVVNEEVAQNSLDDIRVVPNPYVVGHIGEPEAQSGLQSGRGQRLLYFTNIPDNSKIYIFTSRGELVRKVEHSSINYSGTASWDLKNMDGLDIAYGVYFYVVDSPLGKKRGKIAIIK